MKTSYRIDANKSGIAVMITTAGLATIAAASYPISSGETMQGNDRSVEYHYNRLYSTNYNQSIEYTSSAGNWSRAEINVVAEEVSEPRVARKVRSTQWISAGNIERRKVQGPDAGFLMVG